MPQSKQNFHKGCPKLSLHLLALQNYFGSPTNIIVGPKILFLHKCVLSSISSERMRRLIGSTTPQSSERTQSSQRERMPPTLSSPSFLTERSREDRSFLTDLSRDRSRRVLDLERSFLLVRDLERLLVLDLDRRRVPDLDRLRVLDLERALPFFARSAWRFSRSSIRLASSSSSLTFFSALSFSTSSLRSTVFSAARAT